MAEKHPVAAQNAARSGNASQPAREPRGHADEPHPTAGDKHAPMTTNQGVVITDDQNSLRATERGPTLLEDFVLREKITHFDHERIPERVVHARGSAAHGYFELTRSLSQYTTARILTETAVKTPVFTRLSTVAGGAGSIDTPRDVRGMAVKLYTKEGNWDIVGVNIAPFFIQDAMKFPDLVHALKMEPDRGYPQAASAHDTLWDFVSKTPETMHAVMWLMSDRAIPRSLRMIEGFGIHTFRLLDADGHSTFVKFHWRPKLGLQSHIWDEAVKVTGADPDFHRRDLFEAIQAGHYPEWELGVQLFTREQAEDFPFDHLDATKLIPEELVPLKIIGRMVLDRWPDNFFAETEQVAYCPANIVPGIDFSNDPLLQGRLFSYLDTQLIRLGGPNFQQIPINSPQCPFANLQRDGHMQMRAPQGRVSYDPSSLQDDTPRESDGPGFRSFAEHADDGVKGRIRAKRFADHYSQPRQFYRSQTEPEQNHIVSAFVFELSKVETGHVREAVVGHLRHVDEELAQRVANGLGMASLPEAPPTEVKAVDREPSPELQLIGKMKDTLEGRAIGILLGDDSDPATIKALRKAAEDAGAMVSTVALTRGVKLADGKQLVADGQLAGTPSVIFDAVALVLSDKAGKYLSAEAAAVDFVRDAFSHLKAIAFDAGAEAVLDAAGIKRDAGVVAADDTKAFLKAAATRQWDRESSVRTVP